VNRRQAVTKRGIDIVVAAAGLLATGWIIAIAFVAATIDCRNSGFFLQERIGRHGRRFNVIKIRTMRSDDSITTNVTTAGDSRITRLGALMRRLKIDELPQLFNVLVGQMSLVGPRPDVAGFADELTGEDREILDLRPGITGPATLRFRDEEQLLATVNDPERYNRDVIYPEKVRINVEYLRYYTLGTDIEILLKTVLGR